MSVFNKICPLIGAECIKEKCMMYSTDTYSAVNRWDSALPDHAQKTHVRIRQDCSYFKIQESSPR